MPHVFLSPHFDDAVGSCGGAISRLCRAGDDVVVHTIFAGRPSPPYSVLATRLHAEWRAGDFPVDVRRAEDARACRVLGCRAEHSDWLDAIYRRRTTAGSAGPASPARTRRRPPSSQQASPDGWLYPDHAALFGPVAARDRRLPAQIARQVLASIETEGALYSGGRMKTSHAAAPRRSEASRFRYTPKHENTLAPLGERVARERRVRGYGRLFSKPPGGTAAEKRIAGLHAESLTGVRIYAPLGVGHHVDHVLVFQAGRELQARGAQVTFYQDFFYTDWNCPHLAGLRRRARAASFSAADFARKLRAFRCYRSQIPTLFGSAARAESYFADANRQGARGFPYREVFWQVKTISPQTFLKAGPRRLTV